MKLCQGLQHYGISESQEANEKKQIKEAEESSSDKSFGDMCGMNNYASTLSNGFVDCLLHIFESC